MIEPGNSATTIETGIHVYMGGIGFQEFCIVIFTSIAIKFFVLMHAQAESQEILSPRPKNWRKLVFVLYAVLALITVRIIFRMVEFASGIDPSKNPIPYHEAYFMCLDALPMFTAMVLLNAVHPGTVLQGEGSEFPKGPTRKEKKEAKRVRKAEKKAAKEEKKAFKAEKRMAKNGSVESEVLSV